MSDGSEVSKKARTLLRPPKPTTRSVPKWLRKRVNDAMNEGALPRTSFVDQSAVMQYVRDNLGGTWADHLRIIKVDNDDVLVSYPYAEKVDLQMLEGLEKLCSVLKLKYRFSANSHYYPGRTLAIYISPDRFPLDWPPSKCEK